MTKTRSDLTHKQVMDLLVYDPETGIFTWRHSPSRSKKWNSRNAGKRAGYLNHGYRSIQIGKGCNYRANRLAWLYMTGEWPEDQIDHANHDRSDDRWENFRPSTNSENNCNRPAQSNSKSGLRGVHFSKQRKKWVAVINKHGQRVFRKFFETKEAALAARNAAAQEFHGDFAWIDT